MRIPPQGDSSRRARAEAFVRPLPRAAAAVIRSTVGIARNWAMVIDVIEFAPSLSRSGMVDQVCRAGGDHDPGEAERVDLDVLAPLRGLDDLAAAEVHHDVAGVGVGAVRPSREQQVTGLDA